MIQFNVHKAILILVFALTVSCRKTNYGTSLTIQNHLDVELEVETFPLERPYPSFSRKFSFPAGEEGTIYNTSKSEKKAVELIAEAFDSIRIQIVGRDGQIVFTPDTVLNYSVNPYIDTDMWQSRTLEYEICDMTCEDHEDLNYYFRFEPNMILDEK